MIDQPIGDDAVLRKVLVARRPLSADDISPTGARATAILERVLAADASQGAATSQQRVLRPHLPYGSRRFARPGIALSVAAIALAAVVLILAGTFSGPATTGTQSADAAVLSRVATALNSKPGTILIQKLLVTYTSNHGHRQSFELELADQTPNGPGPQNSLYVTTEHGEPSEEALSGGNSEIYLKSTNTIYIASSWGADITKGPKAGTYVYTSPKPQAGPSATLPPEPLTLTAAQANALRDGADQVLATPTGKRIPFHVRLQVAPAAHFPSETASIRSLLKQHLIKVDGATTLDGRPAIKLVGPRFNARHPGAGGGDAGVELYVNPTTYEPIKQVINRPPLFETSQMWTEYRTLPITAANERFLSLTARHPTARIDHNRKDYLRADVFTG